MLNARNLDDQSYAEIVEAAVGRLPWICPTWTDHNAHDPGITILELMAWYKEMQQYHMNQFTDPLRSKLLKLVGVVRKPASPASCAVEIGADSPARPAGARLRTREDSPFELCEAVPLHRPCIQRVWVSEGERRMDVWDMLGNRHLTFQPFTLKGGEGDACLEIGFSALGEGVLRLWFDVEEPEGVARTPFASPDQQPRVIRWDCLGAEGTQVVQDDTHSLSRSGYVTVQAEGTWPVGEEGLFWLRLTLTDPGCEESVRLSGISECRYPVRQQECRAKSYSFAAPPQAEWEAVLDDARGRDGVLAVFLRKADRWEQSDHWSAEATALGRRVRLDTRELSQDGNENVMVVSMDPESCRGMLFDAKGLPGETFSFQLDGRTVLTESFSLLCETLDRDGEIRLMRWHCVDDFYSCGPRDRVFTYDPVRETITFGDGAHGALLHRGSGAVMVADMTLSYCGGGNIPGGAHLRFEDDGMTVRNSAAAGGADRESILEAQARFLRQLNSSRKCVSAADYEALAQATPGLRVALTKALPAYDPEEPTGVSRMPAVTVVVIPASGRERPLPDRRFLDAVQRQLDRYRPVGVKVRAVAPVYADLYLTASVRAGEPGEEALLREKLRSYLIRDVGVGGMIRPGDVAALLQSLPGVIQVMNVDLSAPNPGCYQNMDGEIHLPRCALAILKELRVEWIPLDWSGR